MPTGARRRYPAARCASSDETAIIRRHRDFMRKDYEQPRAKRRSSATSAKARSARSRDNEKAVPLRSASRARRQRARSHRHPAEETRLLHRRAREPAPRPRAARRRQAVLRLDQRARHQSRGAPEARARKLARLGDFARPRQTGRQRARHGARLHRQGLVRRHDRRVRASRSRGDKLPLGRSGARTAATTAACSSRLRASGDDLVVHLLRLERRHPAVELQPAAPNSAGARRSRSTPFSIARCSARARR